MKSTYKNILKIQETDSRIDEARKELENIEEKALYKQSQEEIERLKENKVDVKSLHSNESRLFDKQNGELDMLNQKIKSEEKKLFGGSITNPKELSAIQQEVASLNRKRDEMETIVLEQMDKVSDLEEKLSGFENKISTNSEKGEENKRIWVEKEAKLKRAISKLEKRRQVQAKEVDADLLEDYEDIRERKEGIGAGILIGDTCQVCHVALPATDLERILNKEAPDYCPNCGRILIKR